MRKAFYILLVLLTMLPLTAFSAEKKDVLVVCPYRPSGTWGKTVLKPVLSMETEFQNVTFFYSVLRNSSYTTVEDYNVQLQSIIDRFKSGRPDLILIYGPGNFIAAEDFDRCWKGVPMILVGELDYVCQKEYVVDSVAQIDVPREPFNSFRKGKNVMLIHTPVFYEEILDLINDLTRSLTEVDFVGGEEFLSREIQLNIQKTVIDSGFKFNAFLSKDMSYSQLFQKLSKLDYEKHSLIYCNWHTKADSNDETKPTDGVMRGLASKYPLFNIYCTDTQANKDVLGFLSYDFDNYDYQVSQMVQHVLYTNVQPKDKATIVIPRQAPVVNVYACDKYKIDNDRFPSNALLTNRPPSLYEQYGFLFLLGATISLTLISILLYYLYKRQLKLWQTTSRYNVLVEDAPFDFSKTKLIYDNKGNVVDLRTLKVNKTMRDKLQRANVQMGQFTHCQSYPLSGPDFIRHINEGVKAKLPSVRFSYHMSEYNHHYEVLAILDNAEFIHIFALNTTELMNTQNELAAAKEKAEKSDLIKTQFIQNISHEIRTPLNAVVGFSQLLGLPDGFCTEKERAEYSGYIQNNSEMLIMLIDDILDVADIDNNNFSIKLGTMKCNDICQKAMKTVETRVPSGVELQFTTDLPDDFTITSDSRRVQQVLINYLTNACKNTKEGRILLHCSDKEVTDSVTFSVADTGIGVPPENAERIFQRFTKLDSFKQGSGLGLSICRNIAEQLNGEVKLDTTYKEGARFVFNLKK